MSFKIHACLSDGTTLTDGITVDALTDHIQVSQPPVVKVYRVTRTLSLLTATTNGSTVRVYCEPTDPPAPH